MSDSQSSSRRSLRSSDVPPLTSEPVVPANRRKQLAPVKTGAPREENAKSRPRVHAQRKFAQGQAVTPSSSAPQSPAKALTATARAHPGGQGSSSSSTASGPVAGAKAISVRPGERPKTEDFLTFLCLRGTNLLPPELDFFNRATLDNVADSSDEGSSESDHKAATETKSKRVGAVKKSAASASGKNKKLPASVQALKKKYTEQRLAKKVISKTLPSPTRRTRSQTDKDPVSPRRRRKTVPSAKDSANQKKGGKVATRSTSQKSRVELTTRKPSAAALVARRKTRMATLTAASSRVSRMLTRLTPRGTSSAAFVRSTKKMPLAGRSLRGRDISLSSEEEEEDEDEDKKTPPKRRLKSRKSVEKKKKSEESESDADEENSSRDSSRRRVKTEPSKLQKKLDSHTTKLLKREARSASRESSASKESSRSDQTGSQRPSRKTKEACLTMLGQKLGGRREEDDEDNVSVASLGELKGKKAIKRKENSSKESTPVRRVITASSVKKKSGDERRSKDDNGSGAESEKKKSRKDESKDKKKAKHSLKELQDMLLEEAKKKIATTTDSNASPASSQASAGCSTTTREPCQNVDSEERITISQRTGYIQVKKHRSKSVDLASEEVTVLNPQQIGPAASIGPNGRRLSKNGERTATPPRKILPKSDLQSSGGDASNAGHSHLPVGVIGAAISSSRLNSAKASNSGQQTSSSGAVIGQVPLTQPLIINTSFNSGTPAAQPTTQINTPAGIIRGVPLQMGTIQMQQQQQQGVNGGQGSRSFVGGQIQGVPIVGSAGLQIAEFQQITLPSGIIQPFNAPTQSNPLIGPQQQQPVIGQQQQPPSRQPNSSMVRPQFNFGQQQQVIGQQQQPEGSNSQKQIAKNSLVTTAANSRTSNPAPPSLSTSMSSETDVTTTNTQPLVSPGPPMLSPQTKNDGNRLEGNPSFRQQQQTQNPAMAQVVPNAGNPGYIQTQQGLPTQSAPRVTMVPHGQLQSQQQPQFLQSLSYPSAVPMQPFQQQGSPYDSYHNIQTQQFPVYQQQQTSVQQTVPGSAQSAIPSKGQEQSKARLSTLKTDQVQKQQLKVSSTSNIPQQPSTSSSAKLSSSQSKSEKAKAIFNKSVPKTERQTAKSFQVENESSPYAFEPDPSEPSVPYRKTGNGGNKKPPTGESSKKKTDAGMAIQCNLENAKEMGSSIPIPKELANQLAAQAKKEGTSHNSEMTYFIPLQSSSGQSFGVAVKLGTEGPAGPNQKVIMKAKLVTQPSGKPVGARVISARESSTSKEDPSSSPRKFARMPMASPASPKHHGSDSDSDDSSRPSTSTGRMVSPDSGRRSSGGKQKHIKQQESPLSECCLGKVETLDRFPKLGQHAHLVEAPVYTPTEKEFKDPIKYIECVRKEAEQFGMCRIVPPSSFKPECNVDDDMRFTAYNQLIQKMMHRWGPNAKEMAAIKKYLETQNVTLKPHPIVGGVEIDLPALYHAVQSFGGLTEVIQRKRWGKIADFLRIPKGTQDRGNKLDDIYCKFLLPYDTLSNVEREELLRLVEEEYEESNKRKLERSKNEEDGNDDEDEESEEDEDMECVMKGKSTSLSAFFRVARNLMTMLFRETDPSVREVEEEYWRLVLERDSHIQVQQGSIDTGDEGFGFPTSRASSCGRHAWNLKVLSNNPRSLLRCMGPVMGVTVPTLNVGMVFTSGCWYRDPHGLPWIDYHHTGAPKAWYAVPDSQGIAFYTAMKQLVPTLCRNKKIWLPADTAMVPANLLVKYGVSVCRAVQEPGEFLVVFPKTFTSYVCTGYCLSESVYFAPRDYLALAEEEFAAIRDSGEPMMFPLSKLLLCIAQDELSRRSTLRKVLPYLERMRDNEYVKRAMLSDLGVKNTERIVLRTKKQEQEDEYECEICSENLYVSYMCDLKEDTYYCMEHAIEYVQEKKITQRKHCKLLYTHSKEEITSLIKAVNKRLQNHDESSSSEEDESKMEVKRSFVRRPPTSQQSSGGMSDAAAAAAAASLYSSKGKGAVAKRRHYEKGDSDEESSPERKPKKQKSTISVSKSGSKVKPKEEKKTSRSSATSSSTKKRQPKKAAKDSKKESAWEASSSKRGSSSKMVPESKRRKTKARKAAQDKAGNLAVEILDMLLSASEDDNDDSEEEEGSSDESWK